jgi:uncharacterized protein YjiS (DUF1127 family)
MISTETFAQTRYPERAPRSWKAALATLFVCLVRFEHRRRQAREGEALLHSFSDRMLADIGLRRDQSAPDVRNGDLLGGRGDRARIGRL